MLDRASRVSPHPLQGSASALAEPLRSERTTPALPPYCLVLAGGKSKRLGRDKVAEEIGGECMLGRTTALAGHYSGEVLVSGRDPEPLGIEARWLADEVVGIGPMGGIIGGLARLNTSLLVLACDLPLLDETTLDRLIAAWRERPEGTLMTTFLQSATGFIESLVAIYEPDALPFLRQAATDGCYKMSRVLPAERRHHIPYGDEEASPFFNINYPADLALLKRLTREA